RTPVAGNEIVEAEIVEGQVERGGDVGGIVDVLQGRRLTRTIEAGPTRTAVDRPGDATDGADPLFQHDRALVSPAVDGTQQNGAANCWMTGKRQLARGRENPQPRPVRSLGWRE